MSVLEFGGRLSRVIDVILNAFPDGRALEDTSCTFTPFPVVSKHLGSVYVCDDTLYAHDLRLKPAAVSHTSACFSSEPEGMVVSLRPHVSKKSSLVQRDVTIVFFDYSGRMFFATPTPITLSNEFLFFCHTREFADLYPYNITDVPRSQPWIQCYIFIRNDMVLSIDARRFLDKCSKSGSSVSHFDVAPSDDTFRVVPMQE